MPSTVDHAVINVLDRMDDAVARFAALGFTITARGYHSLGSINHLMMFEHDYLELVGIERGATRIRREVADSPLGLNGLVFKTDDARRLHDELLASGVPALDAVDFDRPVQFENRTERAAFTTIRIDPGWIAGGRIYFCEHKTPHLVWQPGWQTHANGSFALAGFTIVVPDPAAEGRRYERLLGCASSSLDSDATALDLAGFRLTLCTAARYRARYGEFGCADSIADLPAQGAPSAAKRIAYMGSLAIRTRSMASVRRCLDGSASHESGSGTAVRWRDDDARITVAAGSAFDCAIDFVA